MRAVAEDQEIASLMGIDVDRIVVTTFVIGGLLAGIAGVLFALTFEQVNFSMGVPARDRRVHRGRPRRASAASAAPRSAASSSGSCNRSDRRCS